MSQNNVDCKQELKILLLGDKDTGKSCLIKRFYELDISENLASSKFNSYSKMISFSNTKLLLNIIETNSIHVDSQIINESNVIILTYSISSVDSFRNVLRKWKPILDKKNVSCPIVLAGTKLDLRPREKLIEFDKFDLKKLNDREIDLMKDENEYVQLNDAMRMCKNIGNKTFSIIETSSKLNLGVKELFELAIRCALKGLE